MGQRSKKGIGRTPKYNEKKRQQKSCTLLKETALITEKSDVRKLFELLSCANVCVGHPDDKFVRMLNAKHGKFRSSGRGCSAYLDSYASIQLNGDTHSQTVRSSSCEMLSKGAEWNVPHVSSTGPL